MKLFIDDIRVPSDVGFKNEEWTIVRTSEEAKLMILNFIPQEISFDHDLGQNEKTGKDIANWLVEKDLNTYAVDKYDPYDRKEMEHFIKQEFKFTVHSANPVGKENIEKLLNSYLEFRKQMTVDKNDRK